MSTVANVLTAEIFFVFLYRFRIAVAHDLLIRVMKLLLKLGDADRVHALHVEVATQSRLTLELNETFSLTIDKRLNRVDVDLDLP